MDRYVTAAVIRKLREKKQLTQEELADQLHVSSKTISKWETGQGLPDITLLEPLAKALDISVIELFAGESVVNNNKTHNVARTLFYACPVCGNIITAMGAAVISCCGITLPPLQPEEPDSEHVICFERSEDEYYVSIDHPMSKEHHISCLAAISDQGIQFVKLYPEGGAEARFKAARVRWILAYCNHHGLYRIRTIRR